MKNTIQILTIIFILQSCSKKTINNDLIGNWTSVKSSNVVELEFTKDTLFYHNWGKTTKFKWKHNKFKIYYTQLDNIDPKLETKFVMTYYMNLEKDTLYLRNSNSKFTNKFIKSNKSN